MNGQKGKMPAPTVMLHITYPENTTLEFTVCSRKPGHDDNTSAGLQAGGPNHDNWKPVYLGPGKAEMESDNHHQGGWRGEV